MVHYFEAPKATFIYVFRIHQHTHADCVKIGESSINDETVDCFSLAPNSAILNESARKRIDSYTKTAGISYELLHTETATFSRGKQVGFFNDKDVHQVLLRSGIKRKTFEGVSNQGAEWFITDLQTVKQAITAVKQGRCSIHINDTKNYTIQEPIAFRPEQRDAINQTIKQFKHGNQMLWNAKMRFGKTLSALQVVKEMNFSKTLIITHRPVVDDSWFEDYQKIFTDDSPFLYGSKDRGENFTSLQTQHRLYNKNIIYFASIQDLRGSDIVGGKFEKNDEIFSTSWDLIIVDEAHEGTKTSLGENVIRELIKEKTKLLSLSGTAFNLFDDFKEEEIFTWDYIMEQRAKAEWDINHFGDPNPYVCLPKLNIFTYNLGELLPTFADEDIAFNFREFFRVKEDGSFYHEKAIISFLNLLTEKDDNSKYPFSCDAYRAIFRHTLWVLPGVKEAKALSKTLQNHSVFQHFKVINVAGDGDDGEDTGNALELVQNAIGDNPEDTRTITLSCGRLTTGVSVKAWTGVFMLSGNHNTAASTYMQTIFRVQTPATINGKMKTDCYVFDFAPDRTLQVLATVPKVSTKAGKTTHEQKRALGEFLNFCPVISISGSKMEPLNETKMLEQLKKAYVERVVRNGFEDASLYNDELLKLSDVELKDFDNLKGIIGSTKAIGNSGTININSQGLTDEEYEEQEALNKKKKKDLSEEEKARLEELRKKNKIKKDAISILRGISVRMPLLIYGASVEDESKQLTIDNFTSLIDSQSWDEFMPHGVTKQIFNKFKKYYDPEIFSAAGKKIRAMARAADKLTIEDRISRISTIFSTFRNPDKETVLTPWRVVNLHMGLTLGGYVFYDDEFSEILENPRHISHKDITDSVFNSDSKILEINSKSGLYPLYLAYNFYRKSLDKQLIKPESLEEHQKLWDEAVANNVFVICKTPMAKAITKRTLVGFRNAKINAKHFDDLTNQIKNKPSNFTSKVVRGHSYWKSNFNDNMKFNAVVGNPPYQEVVAQKNTKNGQKVSISIFQHFQTISEPLGQYTSLIYPGARWIHRSGKGLEQFGLQQINDPHLELLIYFPYSTDIFKDVTIADGLSIVLKNSEKKEQSFKYVYSKNNKYTSIQVDSPKENLLPLNPLDGEIVTCLENFIAQTSKCLHESILPRSLFSIESDFVEKNPLLVRELTKESTFDPKTEIKLFANDKAGKAGRAKWYIVNRNIITTGLEHLDKWKVIVSSANAGGQKRSNQIAIVDNYSAFGRSRVALKTFSTEKEAQNFYKYATSEIIRFAFLLTDENLTSLGKKVPDLLDYTDENGLIDYDANVNEQLYTLFGINKANQQHIQEELAKRKK